MKIVHVVMNYHPSVGGTQWLFKNISERLVKNYGDEVTVITTDSYYSPVKKIYKKINTPTEIINGVTVHRYSFRRWHLFFVSRLTKLSNILFHRVPDFLSAILYGPFSASLNKALMSANADVVCGSSHPFDYMNYSLMRNKFINPKPFVFMGAVHFTEDVNEKVIRNKTLLAIKNSEKYIANTEFEKERLLKLGVNGNNIVVIGCGIEPAHFSVHQKNNFRKVYGINDDEILIGFVSRQEPNKNIIILIEALQIAWKQNQKIKLVIAGAATWYTEKLQSIIDSIDKGQNRIILLSNISETEKINLFNAIDIFASASDNESFGIVFLEAWACKKPVIGTDVGAIRCVISNRTDGLLVKPLSANEMAEAFIELAENKTLRDELGNNGYQKVMDQFTWDIVTKKYRETYIEAKEKFCNRQ